MTLVEIQADLPLGFAKDVLPILDEPSILTKIFDKSPILNL